MSDTPETDKYVQFNPLETEEEYHLAAFARKLERQRNELAAKFTRLDQPKYSGSPMLDSVLGSPNPAFRAWVESLPATYWARYDLSAARIGWEAAMAQRQTS